MSTWETNKMVDGGAFDEFRIPDEWTAVVHGQPDHKTDNLEPRHGESGSEVFSRVERGSG